MVPFQEMDQQDTQRAFELVELFAPQRLDLLGNVLAVNRVELVGADETRLLLRPRVEVAIVAGADRFVGGREANLVSANATSHGCPLSHIYTTVGDSLRGRDSRPLHEPVHHALLAGLVERDG